MDIESDILSSNEDLLHCKITKSLQKSNNILHKKAIILITSLQSQLGKAQTKGLNGLKKYAKALIDLLMTFTQMNDITNDIIANYEATFFTLSVCIKLLPYETMKGKAFLDRLFLVMEFSFEGGLGRNGRNDNYILMKYAIIIMEKMVYTRTNEELSNPNDAIVLFYQKYFFHILIYSFKSSEESILLQKYLTKSICKVLKDKTEQIKYTIIKVIVKYIKGKLQKMSGKGNASEKEISIISISEGEYVLKFLSTLIQFLSFDIINDLIFEIKNLVEASESKNILMNAFLCIDLAFSTKAFALETSETMLKLLLNKDILLSEGMNDNSNDHFGKDFKGIFLVSYIKAITQVLLAVNTVNQIQSLKYLLGILSMFGEFLTDQDDFIKGAVFNSLQSLISKLFTAKSLNSLFNGDKSNDDLLNFDISLEGREQGNPDQQAIQSQFNNGLFLLEKILDGLLYLLSSRYEDSKIGYNLLLTFIEKINQSPNKEYITTVNERILQSLSDNEGNRSDMLKIFIGKCFNVMPASLINKYFPITILSDDITSDSYTDNTNVWVLSFMDKFLKEGMQSISEYASCYMIVVNELEETIVELKQKKVASDDKEKDDMAMDEDDEDNDGEPPMTKHMKELMVKRFELILTQLISQLPKYSAWCNGYDEYLNAFLMKFDGYFTKPETCHFSQSLKDITFKFLYKVINVAMKINDMKAIEVITTQGKYFQRTINLILSQKLKKSELQEAFNVLEKFCKIRNQNFIYKVMTEMIQRFDTDFNMPEVKTEVNPKTNTNTNAVGNNKTSHNPMKKVKDKLALRIDIINYLLKNITDEQLRDKDNNYIQLLFTFFEKYFFTNAKTSSYTQITKRLFDLFLILIIKNNDHNIAYDTCSQFLSRNGLELISPKQKSKLFELMTQLIISKFKQVTPLTIDTIKSSFTFLIDLITLTKDMNRKVRNTSYELLGQITHFLTSKNLFNDWLTLVLALLASSSPYIKSGAINALARIFWENRSEAGIIQLISANSNVVLLLFKDNNKEIIKSLFIYIRVLLFIIKTAPFESNESLLNTILHYSLIESNESMHKEFKVKIRNLLKNLILNFSYENIKKVMPEKHMMLFQYVNKHLVKKIKQITTEEEEAHGYDRKDLDDSVMLDNEENLLDEEEDYIDKEFKKMDKKDNDMKIMDRIENIDIDDDDMETRIRIEKEKEEMKNKTKAVDKIEELFVKDNVELNNFFYVNPYVFNKNKEQETSKGDKNAKADKDVQFDLRKGKLIVKDLEKEIEESKLLKKKKKANEFSLTEMKVNDVKMLNKKRVQNVRKDRDDEGDDSDGDMKMLKSQRKKMKINEHENKTIISSKRNKEQHQGHYVKYSGDEYKNKKGKGDKLLQGKMDPFAYIQLNPKSVGTKSTRENLKIFETLMKNDNKH